MMPYETYLNLIRQLDDLVAIFEHHPDPEDLVARIREAGAGVIDPDHLLVIAQHFGALPDDVIVIELEPVDVTGGEDLSPEAARHLREVIDLARREAFAPRRRKHGEAAYG